MEKKLIFYQSTHVEFYTFISDHKTKCVENIVSLKSSFMSSVKFFKWFFWHLWKCNHERLLHKNWFDAQCYNTEERVSIFLTLMWQPNVYYILTTLDYSSSFICTFSLLPSPITSLLSKPHIPHVAVESSHSFTSTRIVSVRNGAISFGYLQ